MVLGKGLRLALVGGALGLAGSVSSARMLQSLLDETAAVSPPSYVLAVVLVLATFSAASIVGEMTS